MKVILCQNLESLGKEGTVVRVKDGYARNYLLPKKLAFEATQTNLKKIELQRAKKVVQDEKILKEAQSLAEKFGKISCTVNVEVNDIDKLYGSVTQAEIAKALETEGFQIDKKNIILEKPIEELGIFDVEVKVHPQVTTKIRLWVTKK